MMTLHNFEPMPGGSRLDYIVEHTTPGRDGTVLSANLRLFLHGDKSWCEIKVEDCQAENQKDALDKMATWLRRLADGIEQRKETWIPI